MIERIMLFKLHDPATRSEVARLTQSALRTLPELEALSVGLPADAAAERSWDLSVVIGSTSMTALSALLTSAPFVHYLEQTMKDRYVVLKAWNFERQG
ncbi:MAG: hypothetical protein JWN04_6851 [Myxococcaceae bacterium]|nr:hypothetical protein [Myxococcaceae bacterium]